MSRTIHVLSVQNLNEDQLQRLRSISPQLHIEQRSGSPEEMLTPETEVLYGSSGRFNLQKASSLRWVQVDSAGVNHLHNTPLWHSDITITSANGIHAIQIAEHVLMGLLALGHHLPQMQRLQQAHQWGHHNFQPPFELRGATLGIVGYGAIGREVARLASAFGMRILATKQPGRPTTFDGWTSANTGDPTGSLPERYYSLEELSVMLAESDAVVLAVPLTERTRHVIGSDELAVMPPHALLVNIGRGALIDQEALIKALQEGRIGGAALDVTDPEPLPPESPLWNIDNVIITPHVSGGSAHYNDRVVELFTENLRRYLHDEPLLNIVQRELGY